MPQPFKTGNWDGFTYKRRLLVFPDSPQITDAINGALASILYLQSWQTSGSMTAEETAEALKRMWLNMTSKILDVGDVFLTGNDGDMGDMVKICDGSLLAVTDYPALFAIIGTQFGGDGILNFALPDLRGKMARGSSTFSPVGDHGGSNNVTLSLDNMPAHSHTEIGATATLINGGVEAPASAALPTPGFTGSAGLGTPFDVTPPFFSLHYVMVVR